MHLKDTEKEMKENFARFVVSAKRFNIRSISMRLLKPCLGNEPKKNQPVFAIHITTAVFFSTLSILLVPSVNCSFFFFHFVE